MYVRTFALWLCLMGTAVSAIAGDVLRYSTPSQVQVGPIGQTNWRGVWTAETDLADSMTVLISSNGGAMLPRVSAAEILHDRDGFYSVPLDVQDTADYGTLEIVVLWDGEPVRKTCRVINRLTFDEQYTPVKVRAEAADVTHWGGVLVADARPKVDIYLWVGNAVGWDAGAGLPQVTCDALGGNVTALQNLESACDGTGYNFPNCTMPTTTTVTNMVTSNAIQISGDATAANNAELAFDGTGFGFTNCTIPTVTTTGTATAVTTVNGLAANVITAASIATDAIGSDEAGTYIASRTLATADYFDPAYDTVATVTNSVTVGSVTGNVGGNVNGSVGSISGITFPANFDDLAITNTTGYVTVGTNNDKDDYTLTGTIDDFDALLPQLDTEHGDGSWVDTGGGDATEAKQDAIIAYIDTEVGAILTDTGTTIPGTITTIDTEVGQIKTVTDNLPDSGALSTIGTDTARLTAARAGVLTDWIDAGRLDLLLDAVYTGTPPTVAQIRSEMDSNSTDLNTLITGVNLTTINGTALDSDVDENVNVFFGVNPTTTKTVDDVGTPAGTIDANLIQINGTSIAGTGSQVADRWLGFWNQASAGYSVNTALSSFKADVTNVTVGTNNDKDDYTLTGTIDDFDALLPQLDTEHGDGPWTTGGDATAINQVGLNVILTDIKGTGFVKDTHSLTNIEANIGALNDVSTAQINTEVDTAIETYHLDHLLAQSYDPAAKPGAASALLNRLVENDGGVPRYTSNALEQAPGGGSSPNLLLSTTVATVDSQTQVTLTAGSDQDDAYSGAVVILTDASNSSYPSIRTATDYVGSTKTLVIDAAPGFTSDMIAGDGVNVFIAERTLDQASAIDGKTPRQVLRYLGAVIAGETSGAGTGTEVFKGLGGLTDRVQVIIDVNGNRSTVNYDP